MGYITKSYLTTQFTNFATRIATVFAKKSELPTKTSDLNNDSNFVVDANYTHTDNNYTSTDKTKVDNSVLFSTQTLTSAQKQQARANIGAGTSTFSGSYTDLSNKPTKLSDFTNDSNFITKAVNDLENYYTKTNTYTKSEVDAIISSTKSGMFVTADTLPTSNIRTDCIYLIPSSSSETDNSKDEYINLDGTSNGWELIGSTKLDLSDYLKASDAESTYLKISATDSGNIDFSTYFN